MEKPSAPRATLREIAAKAQVSASAVSLALRNHPRIPISTRKRIKSIAAGLGYRPNPSVATLMTQVRSGRPIQYRETIAWINATDREDYFVNSSLEKAVYGQSLWNGACERADELGFAIDSFWLKAPKMTGRRLGTILAARGIRGLLIPPLPRARGHISIDWSKFAVVAMSYTLARPLFHRVVPDHHNNMGLMLRALRHRDYRKVGLLIPAGADERLENRVRAAFYLYQQSLSPANRVPVLISESPYEDCQEWLRKHRPDAVIAFGGLRNLREIDIGDAEFSKRLGVVLMGYGRSDFGFTAMDEQPFVLGRAAVNHLSGQLSRNERGVPECPETILIKGAWVEGQSLRAASRN